MKITVYCIGGLKEEYWKKACEEYLKRLQPYTKTTIVETPDFPSPEKSSKEEEDKIKAKEAEKVLSKLKPNDFLITLDLAGKELDSPSFAKRIEEDFVKGGSNLFFVIGGSLGLHESLKKRANDSICFGKMTFPHQLSRVILLEQLYRAFRILHNEPYHK